MEKEDLELLVAIRADLIKFFNSLEGKNEPAALVKQTHVARQISNTIARIDKILTGKVSFS